MDMFANFWDGLFWFLVLLTPLVFVHELGHFLVARWNGVRVDVFSIGFGPELFGWDTKSGTRWKISAVPLGGYIKMFGEHAMEIGDDERPRDMSDAERAVSFDHKRLSQRAAVVFAGPAANYLFAIVVLAASFMIVGQSFTPPEVGLVEEQSAAARAGMKPGDIILEIDGASIARYEELANRIAMRPGEEIPVVLDRDGQRIAVTVTPDRRDVTMIDGSTQSIGNLGIREPMPPVVTRVVGGSAADEAGLEAGDRILEIDGRPLSHFEQLQEVIVGSPDRQLQLVVLRDGREIALSATPKPFKVTLADGSEQEIGRLGVESERLTRIVTLGPTAAIVAATKWTADLTVGTLKALGQIVVGQRESKELGGPIMIAQVSSKVAKWGLAGFIELMAMISVSLGLINLFPIPVLDGGHLLFYGIEAVRGRPLGERAQEFSFKIGLALVLSLMIFVTVNDLLHRVL